ncbi:unnamed protein product [Aphanomyces euteiches]
MATANWLSIFTMLWLDPLISRGAKRTLHEEDIWKLREDDTAEVLHKKFQVEWERERKDHADEPSFGRALWRTLDKPMLWSTVIYSIYAILTLVQPTVIKSLLQFLETDQEDDSMLIQTAMGISSGYALAAILTVLSFLFVTLADFGQYLTSNLGVNGKSIVMDAAFLKTLKLSSFGKSNMSSGEIVTLSSVDSERVFQGYITGPWVIVAPATLLIVFILIGFDMGYIAGIAGGVVMAAVLYWGYVNSKAVVKLTNEVLQGVRVVIMYAWEDFLQDQIADIRKHELKLLHEYQQQRVLNTVGLSIAPVISLAVCLATHVALGYELTPALAFTTLAYMNVARLPCTVFSSSIMFASEAIASCTRVGKFLTSHEMEMICGSNPEKSTPKIEIEGASFSWLIDPKVPTKSNEVPGLITLKNINLTITPMSLTIVVGAVGSGKSSLINAILGEIQLVSGSRRVNGSFSYVSQDSWIQRASLKDNILFASVFDKTQYDRVLSACQLKPDLAILPDGDATEIGERGINLSGGQKARVSLARAIALDVHVAGAVFQECIQNLLKDKTVILVLNSHYHFLPKADRVLVMEDGMIVGDGTFDEVKVNFPHLNSFEDEKNEHHAKQAENEKAAAPTKAEDGTLVTKEDRRAGGVTMATYLIIKCSMTLHSKLLAKVIQAPVNTFFDITPIIAVAIVCAVSSPFILIIYVPMLYLVYKVQAFFNASSGDLKRLESVSRTPVVNLISETNSGLSTIRAFDMTEQFAKRNREAIDHNQSYLMIYRIASRWLQMRLDWLSAVIIAGVAFIGVATKSSISVTAAGLALTYASQMSAFLSRATFGWSMFDHIMTCVERLDHYNTLDTEGKTQEESATVPKEWPVDGNVSFESYSMRYRDHLDLVLRDVSFVVNGGEKVGICGRTGSGKSSLMVALFRMVEASSGCIKIDGVDISQVNLQTLRCRLTIIPQDPILFSGSLRFNIDPSQQASDADLWAVLKKVHLADRLEGGLDFQVAEKGSNLSVGQRQLLCIARALLRQSRVVVLDEATANIDLESDRLIQQTIKDCFRDVTKLIIAHRLDTIINSDRILVMDHGSAIEYDSPEVLLAKDGGAFAELAKRAQLTHESI